MLAQILRTLLFTSLSVGLYYYVWRRIVRAPQWPRRFRQVATALMVTMFVAVPITMIAARLGAAGVATALGWIAMPWMVAVGLTAVWCLGIDLVRASAAIGRGARRWLRQRRRAEAKATEVPDPERRLFLSRAASSTAMVATAASLSSGMLSARGEHEIVTTEIPLVRLPRELDGFTIVQLSDLHVGVTIGREFVSRVVERSNALRPDLIVLTGDLVDGKVDQLRDDVAPLGELRARHGVYAVPGNHEYYYDADEWIAELTRLGATYLLNRRVAIGDGRHTFDLAGVEDHSAYRYPGHGADLAAAVRGRDPTRALVLLAHQPRQLDESLQHRVDLQLSGHTHGGQVWPWHYLARAQQRGLLAGLYRRGDTQVYVTRGCGYFGPPIRLGAPLEISRLVLRAG